MQALSRVLKVITPLKTAQKRLWVVKGKVWSDVHHDESEVGPEDTRNSEHGEEKEVEEAEDQNGEVKEVEEIEERPTGQQNEPWTYILMYVYYRPLSFL